MHLIETNIKDLFLSTVKAFPDCKFRQHAIDPIKIVELTWTPYTGVKTLFIKGLAESGKKEYNPIVLFKKVDYFPVKNNENIVQIQANDGITYFFNKLNDNNEVLVRCNCADFNWRFCHFNHVDESLYGRNRKKYEANVNPGSANPAKMEGMCKHLIKLVKTLNQAGILEG